MKSSGIGGQAVLEGVMMRNKSEYAVAIRKPDGEIAVTRGKVKSLSERALFFRLPIIRGVVAFFESLVIGMRMLTYSSEFYEEGESNNTKEKSATANAVELGITFLLSIVIAIGAFVVLPYYLSQLFNNLVASPSLLALIEGVTRAILFIGYVIIISFMKDINRVFMYHGAEHKTINCIEHGLPLAVGNVKTQSKHHQRCGTNFLFVVIFLSIIFFMFIHFDNLWLRLISRIVLIPVIAGVSYECIRFAGESDNKFVQLLCKPGMYLQRLTTREPDDKMIEVAIASVEEIFDWEAYQRRAKAAKKLRNRSKKKRMSRSEMAEELRRRELENARRANERARRMMERERKEAQLEKMVDEAKQRNSERKAMLHNAEETDEEALSSLDHFFEK